MKIIISYPPLNGNGCPLLGQNRQFQWFSSPTYIYPVVPAQAATLLKNKGYEVIWNDCAAEGIHWDEYLNLILSEKPDIIALETKTPIIQQHWNIINELKKLRADSWEPKTVLFGDHVTALPEESFYNSKVDFVLTGGDYDFLLLNLCNFLSSQDKKLEPGIFYRQDGLVKNTGQFRLNHNLDSLPFIDRELTKWKLYACQNGNYKKTPGTYIMSGRDCWYHKCTFCSWPTLYPEFRIRSVNNVLDEIDVLIKKYGVKEIMDDTGTFPTGDWLKKFCTGMIERGYNKKIYFDCNMRFGSLCPEEYRLMKKAGFRLLLFGLESASQNTLERIRKSLTVSQIIDSCKMARKAGLYPHITIMFGYPWESKQEELKTLVLGKWLLKKGYAYTMQATVVIPYPGSPLFEECKANDLLKTFTWSRYDMKEPIMKTSLADEEIMGLVQNIYSIPLNLEFLFRRIISIKDIYDVKYFIRAFSKIIGHVFDFKVRKITSHSSI
jgi:radical SAM superfamily enzyme YgiQ (UPF0313 family)